MASSGYVAWSVVAGEMPTTAKWNLLGSNDASFNTGTGFNDGVINTRHLASGIQVAPAEQIPYKFSAYLSSALSPADGATNTVVFDTKLFDTGSNYNNATGVFTAPAAGYYQYHSRIYFDGNAGVRNHWELRIVLYLNGTTAVDWSDLFFYSQTQVTQATMRLADIIYLNANDTLQILEFDDVDLGTTAAIRGGRQYTSFSVCYRGAT